MARKSRKHLIDTVDAPTFERVHYKAAGYIRLSGDDTKKRGDSLETQRSIIERHIATLPDIRLVDIYTDNKISGTGFERPEFQRMLNDIESGRINCIIVKDVTRFGRNAIDAGYYMEMYLPQRSVRFISITDSYDSLDGDGGLLLPLKNIIAESYALDIGRKCRAVQRQNIADGRFVGRLAPYGYMKDPDDCHKLIVNEDTAPIVQLMFDLAHSGVACSEIARRLSADGIATPSQYNFSKGLNKSEKLRGTAYWKCNAIVKILSDRVYVGDMVQGKTQTMNHDEAKIAPSDWICVPNTHEPIISVEVFDSVQKIRNEIQNQFQETMKNATSYSVNMFKGKMLCAGCGRLMRRQRQQKDGIYWFRCESQTKYGKNACTVVSVKEADLIAELLAMIYKQAEAILGKCISLEKSAASEDYAAKLREIDKGLDKDGRMLRSLYENMVKEIITTDEFAELKATYEAEIAFLHQQADNIRIRQYEASARAKEYRSMADTVSHILGDEALTSSIIDTLVSKITVHPDKSFDVLFNFKDEYSTSRYYVPEHLRLHGGNRRVPNGGLEVRHAG